MEIIDAHQLITAIDKHIAPMSDSVAIDFLDILVDRLVTRIESRQWDLKVAQEDARNIAEE